MTSFGGGYKGRLEDERMLKGRGRYVSDWTLPRQAAGHFLRSDRPHAKILSIDVAAALGMPGVIAVVTGKELTEAGLRPIPAAAPVIKASFPSMIRMPLAKPRRVEKRMQRGDI